MSIGTRLIAAVAALGVLALLGCNGANSPEPANGADAADIGGSAAVTPRSGCELAAYPSVEWTLCETQNLAVSLQNTTAHVALTPELLAATAAYQQARLTVQLTDPERQPNINSCTTAALCPIDPRVQNWTAADGLVEPVLYTSRSGGTISGHVWATRSGPDQRPGVVIINGSVVGFEQIYWFAAQALAKAGFVVMTFDAQGEGNSDQFGESPDEREAAFAGIPGLGLLGPTPEVGIGLGGNGIPFYDGGTDALDFFLSTPARPYLPVASRSSRTSHAAKQQRRVAAGLNTAYNPLAGLLDARRIGLAGHSYGAVAASWLAQQDARVSAVVAWDALCVPVFPSPDEYASFTTAAVNQVGGTVQTPLPLYGLAPECFGAPSGPAPALSKPALGINSDYLLAPTPYLAPPRPQDKSGASLRYSAAGVETGNITIRGGTHYDYNDVPAALPATLRGIDLLSWYTVAWFAKYLQDDPDADRMLLTARWRNDAAAGAADPAGDPNLYSWHYASRLDIRRAGGSRFNCENLRNGCAGQYTAAEDCGLIGFSFATLVNAPGAGPPAVCSTPRP